MGTANSGLSIAQQMLADGSLPDAPSGTNTSGNPAPSAQPQQSESIARQMLQDGSLPDMPVSTVPMRAVVAAAATTNPDAEAKTQQLAQQAGMGVDLTRANPEAAQQRVVANDLDRRELEIRNPILARQLSDPSFAAVAHDDLDSLSRIEQNAAVMRAPTFGERVYWNYLNPATRAMMQFPLTRMAINTITGAEGMAGDVGSFFGWHGSGPTRQNFLQSDAAAASPEALGLRSNQFDTVTRTLGPLVASIPLTMGLGALGDAAGLSENATKVLTALGAGGAFTAQQGGQTFTRMAASGKSDAEARHDADLVAALNAVPNVAMGLTDMVPGLRDYPLLSALGAGGTAGAVGQFAQNKVTGQPWTTDLGKGAVEGAAVQGGIHLGFDFLAQMGDTVRAVEASKLRLRSPEQFQRYADATFEGDPSVRIPAQEFVDYFAKQNIDPAVMANRVGVTNLEEAAAAGSDLEIPKANFFAKLDPEHQKALLPDVIDPATDMTAHQAEAGRAELQDWAANGGAEKLMQEFTQADAETKASPEWQKVYTGLKQQYVDAGEVEPVAEKYATLQANAISYFAKNTSLGPEEVLELHNPRIVAGEAPGVVNADTEPVRYQDAIEDIRSVVNAARQPGHATQKAVIAPADSWLVQTAMEHGLDVADHNHVIDGSAVRHVINRHSDAQVELSRGQLPVTDADFDKIPDLISSPDAVVFGTKTRGKRDQIGYIKRQADGTTLYLEEARTGKKELAAVSMRKYPAAKDFDAIAGTLPSNARSDGGNEPIVVRNPNALKPGEPLHQEAPEGTRGWFRLRPDGSAEIGRTKLSDFSTFIHEPAHGYLELFRTMTQREDASDQLKADFATICKSLGTTADEVYKDGFTRAQHELWARMSENYVREGRAPNGQLRRVFHAFGVWLHRIYRQANALGVEMDPEIHGVMDRLFAGEHAVDRAESEAPRQRLFEKPEDAGMTEEQFHEYADSHNLTLDEARAQVRSELNQAAEREQSQDRMDEARNVRDAVTEQVDAQPEYKAIRSLRRGSLDDETPLTLNRQSLADQFGEDRVKALNKLHRGLYRNEGGTDAETAAEIFGYGSGEEMMRAIENAPRRSAAIEAATRDYLVNKYGDVRYDGTLNDRARFALENKERAGNIYRELKALRAKVANLEKKTADAKAAMASIAIEPLEHYQEAAHAMIQQKAPADLQPHRYLDASRRFSREAFDAARKGNARRAMEAKNKELLNHFLFREAAAEREWVGKFEKFTQRVQTKGVQQRLGLADESAKQAGGVGDFRDQFNWLLARYKLDRMGPQAIRQPERSLRDWAQAMYDKGDEPAIAPGVMDGSGFADYHGVPMSELHDVQDALTNVRHLAQREFQAYVQGKQIRFAEARTAMVSSARENLKVKPETIFEENRSRTQKMTGALQYADARLTPMERWIEWLDGGKTGPWHDNIWNLAADAQGDEDTLQHEVTKAVTDALADMPDEMRRRLWTEKVNVEGIPEPLTRRRLLSMAFNMGNAGNLDRLQKTFDYFGWDRDAIKRIGGMLTREEWQFVQRAWDSLKPLGQRANEMQRRLTGLPLTMVDVTPFKVELADGTEMELRGGYFPIVMDPKHSQRAIEQDSRESAQNAMQSGYVRATTSKGYTKERTGFGGPLLLDYERAMTSHVAKVTKDLSHREFMLSTQRLLLDTEVRKTLRETLGPQYEAQFMPWLRTIINDNNGSVQEGLDTLKDGMQKLRANFVAGALGFNPSTVLLQISHAPRMVLYARPASLVQSLVDFLARPMETTARIHELSPNEMRFRGDNIDRDLRAVLQNPSYKGGYTRKVAVAARFALATVDHLLSHTLWQAAYRDAMGKYTELPAEQASAKAVHEADSAVRLGLGAHAPKDLPAIMRNNEFNKFVTTLYGFHNGVYSQLRDIGHQFRYDRNLGKLTLATILTATLPTVLGSALTGHGPKDGENVGWWAAKRSLLFAADTVPMLRSAASYMDSGSDVQFSPIESVMQKGAKAAMEATSDKDDKDWTGIGLRAADAAGEALGVPGIHAVTRTLGYMHRANEGKIANPNVWNAIVGGG